MFNIPNLISLVRILLVPVFWAVFWSTGTYHLELAMGVLALAGLTDIVDGYVARKYRMITPVGKILDPAADKLMVIIAIFSLYLIGRLPIWLVVLILAKEACIVVGSLFMILGYRVQVSASLYGKAATVSIYIALFWAAFNLPGSIYVTALAAMVSLAALVNYIYSFIRHRLY